jgi:hypothetical protein
MSKKETFESSNNIKILQVNFIDKDNIAIGQEKVNLQSLPLRSYLDKTVIPVLMEGLKAVANERFFCID